DHPKEIMIAVSPGGEVFTCEEIIKPESCFDEQGNDQLDRISSEDKNYFESDSPGYLFLELPPIKYEGISALFSGGPPPIKKVGHPSITYNYLKVEIWRDSEFWEEIATIPPRVNVDLSMTNLIPYILSEEEVKIKLSWNDNYKADHIGFYFLKYRIEDIKKLCLIKAGLSESGSVLSQLSKEDGNRAVLNPGQRINLTFASEPEPENLKRDFILVTKGHYVTDKNFASQHPSDIPDELKVSQNYPNPFNPTTEIRYDLPQNAWVKLTVYNVLGQKVKVLVNQHQEAGYKIIHWDSRNEKGEYVSTGIYFYTLQVGSYTKTKKMLLLR
ncbi:MAG: T9SS type A sorting domain-containing protein, partial [Candidatus Zixiibacteriota bacterium]